MNHSLQDLQACGDVKTLESALHTLCSEFGKVSWLDILTMSNPDSRQAVCLLRLDSWEHEQKLMQQLGASRFGDELCLVVNLHFSQTGQA